MTELLGYVGGFCFALCAVPQAWQAYRDGNSDGLDPWFLALWLGGEVCFTIAILLDFGWVSWLMLHYLPNLVCVCVLVRYKVFPKDSKP